MQLVSATEPTQMVRAIPRTVYQRGSISGEQPYYSGNNWALSRLDAGHEKERFTVIRRLPVDGPIPSRAALEADKAVRGGLDSGTRCQPMQPDRCGSKRGNLATNASSSPSRSFRLQDLLIAHIPCCKVLTVDSSSTGFTEFLFLAGPSDDDRFVRDPPPGEPTCRSPFREHHGG